MEAKGACLVLGAVVVAVAIQIPFILYVPCSNHAYRGTALAFFGFLDVFIVWASSSSATPVCLCTLGRPESEIVGIRVYARVSLKLGGNGGNGSAFKRLHAMETIQ